MEWTREHDLILCREILATNPFSAKKATTERGRLWGQVANVLNSISQPKFDVNKRSVRDHLTILQKRYKRKMKEEENASGISPEPTELDLAVEEIITLEEISENDSRESMDERQKQEDADKVMAEEIRKQALETLSATHKRNTEDTEGKVDDSGTKLKRKRRSGNETIEYLRDKAGKDFELKKEELHLKKEQQDIENKRHDDSLAQQERFTELMVQQQQQMQLIQQQQQQQANNFQAILLQQQQQQAQTFVALIEKLAKK